MPHPKVLLGALGALLGLSALAGCWDEPTACASTSDCFVGEVCASGQCAPPSVADQAPDTSPTPDMDPVLPDMQDASPDLPDVSHDMTPTACGAPTPLACGEACVDPQTDATHCGGCDRPCAQDEMCVSGACAPRMDCRAPAQACQGFTYCDDSDGRCKPGCAEDSQCRADQRCTDAHQCACPEGLRDCGGACRLAMDPGACGPSCEVCETSLLGLATCAQEQCQLSCDAGARDCGQGCAPCPEGRGVRTTGCMAGACVITACESGYTPCDSGCCRATLICRTTPVIRARPLTGNGPWTTAPLTVPPFRAVELDASTSTASIGSSINERTWTLVRRPEGSRARFNPNTSNQTVQLLLDKIGEYEVELSVGSLVGESCTTSRLILRALPQEDFYAELTWRTPGDPDPGDDDGADLDLHYLREGAGARWNRAPDDIHWRNETSDWGPPGSAGDARLVREDDDGRGPVLLRHDDVPDGAYSVAVHVFDDGDFGPSQASVRLFIDGQIALERRAKPLNGQDVFWLVARARWPERTLTLIDTLSTDFP